MSDIEKIFEGSTVVVKATVLPEHTEKLKSVTFKFFQDGKAPKSDELSEGSEFEKKYTADDVGNGTEEDNIDGYDVIVHKVSAPAVAKDQEVLTVPGKDKILGATIVGPHSGELITEFVTAMKNNLGLNKILGTIHIYPTLSEANKYAAGEWKRAHAPTSALKWVEKFHRWQREGR